MNNLIDLYVVDAGNSRIKLGSCSKFNIINIQYFNDISSLLKKITRNIPIAVSSVLNSEFKNKIHTDKNPIFWINHQVKLPFKINYLNPETLGVDRICNVAALSKINNLSNCLSIDIGTCIKFDFLNAKNEYEGGSISPGLQLRFKALNLYTDKLPLIEPSTDLHLTGKSTKSSIQSGVQIGMLNEIVGLISCYQEKYVDLRIFITGGDVNYFDLGQKKGIFADENLTLKGIIEIYKLNA
jgi:type III pantothenate kinase